MRGKFQFEYLTYLVCPDHATGCVRFRTQELIADVTDLSWVGGELRAKTKTGTKRVVFGDDGSVKVEDVAPETGVGMSRDELSATARQVADYFGANEPEQPADVNRDVESFLSR